MNDPLQPAVTALRAGGVIAYPTEAVYGLGCDPHHQAAVARLFTIKQRSPQHGLLLIASDYTQIEPYIGNIPAEALARARATWPGPHTWVFPRSAIAPAWITGAHSSIALRVTAHPLAAALCQAFGGALISTSANRHGEPPAKNTAEVRTIFDETLDFILEGSIGELTQPTPIRDALSGEVFRP